MERSDHPTRLAVDVMGKRWKMPLPLPASVIVRDSPKVSPEQRRHAPGGCVTLRVVTMLSIWSQAARWNMSKYEP